MDISIVKLYLKRTINTNYYFMMAVSLVFGIFASWGKDISLQLNMVPIETIILMSYVFPFIMFSTELSKDNIQADRITRKVEWLLANGTRLSSICINSSFSIWIATSLLMLPMLMITSAAVSPFTVLGYVDFFAYTLILCFVLNIRVLGIKNMNRFKSIGIQLSMLHFFVLLMKSLLINIVKKTVVGAICKYVIVFCILAVMLRSLSVEKIVSSYY